MTFKEYVTKRTTKQLQEEKKQIEDAVNVFDCFNVDDLTLLDYIYEELENRKKI